MSRNVNALQLFASWIIGRQTESAYLQLQASGAQESAYAVAVRQSRYKTSIMRILARLVMFLFGGMAGCWYKLLQGLNSHDIIELGSKEIPSIFRRN